MNELALFAGAGGGLLAGHLLGWHTVCAVENDPYCREVLFVRQRDGMLPRFPIWDDVRTFDGRPWCGHADVVSGGFPCQDISSAGKGVGLDGERSGLWREFARILGEVRPTFAFIENSPWLRTRGLVRVLKDLTVLGYDAIWDCLGASDVGAPHRRKRMWIVAYLPGRRSQREQSARSGELGEGRWETLEAAGLGENASHSDGSTLRKQPRRWSGEEGKEAPQPGAHDWWPVAVVSGVDDGLAHRLDRVRATGNGQVPRVAAMAWKILSGLVERV